MVNFKVFLDLLSRTLIVFFTKNSGLITGLRFIGDSDSGGWQVFVGILMLVTALGFGVVALADFFLLVRVRLVIASN